MFITTNPFAQLNAESPEIFTPGLMQGFVILMILLVIGGTLFGLMFGIKRVQNTFLIMLREQRKKQHANLIVPRNVVF